MRVYSDRWEEKITARDGPVYAWELDGVWNVEETGTRKYVTGTCIFPIFIRSFHGYQMRNRQHGPRQGQTKWKNLFRDCVKQDFEEKFRVLGWMYPSETRCWADKPGPWRVILSGIGWRLESNDIAENAEIQVCHHVIDTVQCQKLWLKAS